MLKKRLVLVAFQLMSVLCVTLVANADKACPYVKTMDMGGGYCAWTMKRCGTNGFLTCMLNYCGAPEACPDGAHCTNVAADPEQGIKSDDPAATNGIDNGSNKRHPADGGIVLSDPDKMQRVDRLRPKKQSGNPAPNMDRMYVLIHRTDRGDGQPFLIRVAAIQLKEEEGFKTYGAYGWEVESFPSGAHVRTVDYIPAGAGAKHAGYFELTGYKRRVSGAEEDDTVLVPFYTHKNSAPFEEGVNPRTAESIQAEVDKSEKR